ncbi:kinase-like domain-containing protein, partial [Tribonema minus]
QVFSFFVNQHGVDEEEVHVAKQVCRRWRDTLGSATLLWRDVPWELPGRGLNWARFECLGKKASGTEGICFRCRDRATGRELALKKARVYPQGEGVPYYMLRELAVLRDLRHPNVSRLRHVSLHDHQLRVFFDFVPQTLHDFINPPAAAAAAAHSSGGGGGDAFSGTAQRPTPVPQRHLQPLLRQLLLAVAACHRRGVLHRNLKPKHVLVRPREGAAAAGGAAGGDALAGAHLLLSDFALVRLASYPRRAYTSEVVTLWYRPPELLMGAEKYTPAVDMWSAGCIFAEMALGRPLFTGISEIDQLFQIFSRLGTPDARAWPDFTALPNYSFAFPHWGLRVSAAAAASAFPTLEPRAVDLLDRMFTYDPARRITAEEALRHPYLIDADVPFSGGSSGGGGAAAVTRPQPGPAHNAAAAGAPARARGVQRGGRAVRAAPASALRPDHRSMLVDWLVEVVDVFEMCQRSAFLAVAHMDRYLARAPVSRKRYQLLGATCLHIASKCEDVAYIGIEDLALCADKVYQPKDVLDMEERVLNALDFQLAIPTPLDFCNLALELSPGLAARRGGRVVHLAQYLAEITLQDAHLAAAPPSAAGAACVVLALALLREAPAWGAGLARV